MTCPIKRGGSDRGTARPPRIKAIDFFCGAGGLTRGLRDSGIDVLGGVDNDIRLKRTYEANNRPSRFVMADINTVDIVALRQDLGITIHDTVVYAACTPCQPFSTLNQRRGRDDRKSLLLSFSKLVIQAPPDFIIVENVPGLKNKYGRRIYETFLADLSEAGFAHHDADLLDAQDYGVPQIRKRFILVASRKGPITLPARVSGRKATVRTAIGKMPAPTMGLVGSNSRSAPSATSAGPVGTEPRLPNHIARKLSSAHVSIMEAVPVNGGSRSDIGDTSVLLACHQRNPKLHKDVFGRMRWDGPAPTLTCRCTDVYCGRFGHPEENRGLTLREAAALQTFPNNYVFHGTFFHAAAQIGNAVPVRLAKHLGRAVLAAHQAGAA
jgi:DNA (cytosine-5)-methyltransferase 1